MVMSISELIGKEQRSKKGRMKTKAGRNEGIMRKIRCPKIRLHQISPTQQRSQISPIRPKNQISVTHQPKKQFSSIANVISGFYIPSLGSTCRLIGSTNYFTAST